MPDFWRNLIGWVRLIGFAAIVAAIVVAVVVKFGFAWALIACVVAFWLRARKFDPGPYGENAFGLILEAVWLAVCLTIGLIAGLLVNWI